MKKLVTLFKKASVNTPRNETTEQHPNFWMH